MVMGTSNVRRRSRPSFTVRALWYVALAIAVGAFLFQMLRGSVGAMAVGQVARAYVALVRQAKLDAAYGMLSPATRRSVKRARFPDALGTPQIRHAGSVGFAHRVVSHGTSEACLPGNLWTGGRKRRFEVFLRRESGAWRVVTVWVHGAGAPPGPWPCGGR